MLLEIYDNCGHTVLNYSKDARKYMTDEEFYYLHQLSDRIGFRMECAKFGSDWKKMEGDQK